MRVEHDIHVWDEEQNRFTNSIVFFHDGVPDYCSGVQYDDMTNQELVDCIIEVVEDLEQQARDYDAS